LYRTFCVSIIVFLCVFMQIPLGQCSSTNENSIDTLGKVIKDALEDTTWLRASTHQEMEQLLGAYYTWPVLQILIESAWNFVRVPSDWEYLVTTGNCTITYISEDRAGFHADILETDEITGVTHLSRMEYLLVNTEKGWRISDVRTIWP